MSEMDVDVAEVSGNLAQEGAQLFGDAVNQDILRGNSSSLQSPIILNSWERVGQHPKTPKIAWMAGGAGVLTCIIHGSGFHCCPDGQV